jgi:hypothetical protein
MRCQQQQIYQDQISRVAYDILYEKALRIAGLFYLISRLHHNPARDIRQNRKGAVLDRGLFRKY